MPKRIITCVLCLLLIFADGSFVKASEVEAQNYEGEIAAEFQTEDAENLDGDDGVALFDSTRAANYSPFVNTRYVYLSGYIYLNVVMPDGSLSIYKVDCSVPYNDYAGSQQITYTMQLVSGTDLGANLKDGSYYTKSDENGYNSGYQVSSRQYIFPFSVKFNRNLTGYHVELVGVTGQENCKSVMTGYGSDWVSFDTDTNDNGMTNYGYDSAFRHATYTVQYVPNNYTLTLNSNGGTYNSMAWDVSFPLTYATRDFNRIGCPQRTGYLFNGWFDGYGTQVYDANGDALPCTYWSNYGAYGYYQYPGDFTVYAHWTPITYYVVYNGNGNTGGTTATSTHTYDTAKSLNGNGYVKTGYSFTGWNTRADGKGTTYSNNASVNNLTATHGATIPLYAQWKPYTHTVVFNANGGSGAPGNQTKTYGSTIWLSSSKPVRAGYTFTGWNTKVNGSGTHYDAGSEYGFDQNGGTVTLYAQWRLNPVTVSVPRSLILNQDGDGTFVIKADNETGTVTINADNTIKLTQKGKNQVLTGTVSFNQNTLTPDRHKIKGSIDAQSLTAGSWNGVINLNITFKL